MRDNYLIIEKRILKFVKKYYLNKVVKGLLFSIIIAIILTLLAVFTELFFYFSSYEKKIILTLYLTGISFTIVYGVLWPLLGFFGIGNTIKTEKINELIVEHFPDIKDQLLNIIELNNQANENNYSNELIIASIDQKISSIKHFDFNEAISLKEHRRFLWVLFGFIASSILLVMFMPSNLKSSASRLLAYNVEFEKPSPYQFILLNEALTAGKGDNYNIRVKVDSDKEFTEVLLGYGDNQFMMKKDSLNIYSYELTSVNNDVHFNFSVGEFHSKKYTLEVLPKPVLAGFDIEVKKPAYTGLKNEVFNNVTEIIVPHGSKLAFSFQTFYTDTLFLSAADQSSSVVQPFNHELTVYNNALYSIGVQNKYFESANLLSVNVELIPDDYPAIDVDMLIDSMEFTRSYFKGIIADDYGISNLNFISKVDGKIDSIRPVQFIPNLMQQDFFYAYNFNFYKGVTPEVEYYFEVGDNDAINGSKKSTSEVYLFRFPDQKDINNYQEEQFDNIEEVVSESMNLTNQIKEDLADLKQKMINSELSDWEKKEAVKNIFSNKMQLEKALDEIKERNKELNSYLESYTEQNEELIEKQNRIEEMLEEIMSDELKKLMDEFNKMMEQFDQEKVNNLSEQLDISLDDLSEQLDRNISLLKRMKIEQQLSSAIEQLKQKADEQNKLQDSINNGVQPESLSEKQEQSKKEMSDLEEQYEKIQQLNDELEEPVQLYDFEDEFGAIQEEFDQSIDQLNKNKEKSSRQSLENNKQKMEALASMMQQMMDAAFAQQNQESIEDLLQILDNLVLFSVSQEEVIVKPVNQQFDGNILAEQKKLYTDFGVIKDSIYALARREPSINSVVNKEIVTIENSFVTIDKNLSEDRVAQSKVGQQVVLTSANNLALFLSEVIKNMQEQQANSMPGNQNCQKPGNNPNPNSMGNSLKQMQKSMQEQLEKMMQMMKEGSSGQSMSQEMGKALAQQEKMKDMLQKMMQNGNVGSNAFETLKQAEQLLDKVKEDIIRDNLSDQTVDRQREILTRLLEAENAENERELDEKRKSSTAQQNRISETAKYFDNTISNDKFDERLLREKLILKRYYQLKYQNYVNQLDSINGSNN
ncbi:coiled-coil domain-containing protein [Roseimarinus sediminis]|uniref:hypothetical protein n=1 Tax=Roseimarinus sediminis TaxID=1610899 RepID=UPI003D201FAF